MLDAQPHVRRRWRAPRTAGAAVAAGLVTLPATGADVVTPLAAGDGSFLEFWDNGPVNGVNGYSNATAGVFGARRTVLDDFTLTDGQGAVLQRIEWNSVWSTIMGGTMGVGAEITIRQDDNGAPGLPIEVLNITGYSEVATGNVYFSRDEVTHYVDFDDFSPGGGHFWIEATVQGPENNFWLTSDQILEECWVNYDDLGGLQPGTEQFGVASGINFRLLGVPGPGALGLLLAAGIARARRHRA